MEQVFTTIKGEKEKLSDLKDLIARVLEKPSDFYEKISDD